jgi:hypothetical protein
MSVPDTTTFTQQDVADFVDPSKHKLTDLFLVAETIGGFDPAYEGAHDRLLNFRNFGAFVKVIPANLVWLGVEVPISGDDYGPTGLWFSDDGLKMFVMRDKGQVQSFNLVGPWDIRANAWYATDVIWDNWTRGFGMQPGGVGINLNERDNVVIQDWTTTTPYEMSGMAYGIANYVLAQRPVTVVWQPDGMSGIVLDTHDSIGHGIVQFSTTVQNKIEYATETHRIEITTASVKEPYGGFWDNAGENYYYLSNVGDDMCGPAPAAGAPYDLSKFSSSSPVSQSPGLLVDSRSCYLIPGTSLMVTLQNNQSVRLWDMPEYKDRTMMITLPQVDFPTACGLGLSSTVYWTGGTMVTAGDVIYTDPGKTILFNGNSQAFSDGFLYFSINSSGVVQSTIGYCNP